MTKITCDTYQDELMDEVRKIKKQSGDNYDF